MLVSLPVKDSGLYRHYIRSWFARSGNAHPKTMMAEGTIRWLEVICITRSPWIQPVYELRGLPRISLALLSSYHFENSPNAKMKVLSRVAMPVTTHRCLTVWTSQMQGQISDYWYGPQWSRWDHIEFRIGNLVEMLALDHCSSAWAWSMVPLLMQTAENAAGMMAMQT